MTYCEQCVALQRQNDLLANDRDGYVQLLTNENNKLRSEIERLREWNREIALNAREFVAENEKLRAYALKAFTVVEFCSGEGLLLPHPTYDCDDLLMEGVELLKVETSEEARAALKKKPND